MMVVVEVEVEGGRMMQSGSLVLSSDAHWFGGDSGRIGRHYCLVQLSISSQIYYYQKPTSFTSSQSTQSIDITLWDFN